MEKLKRFTLISGIFVFLLYSISYSQMYLELNIPPQRYGSEVDKFEILNEAQETIISYQAEGYDSIVGAYSIPYRSNADKKKALHAGCSPTPSYYGEKTTVYYEFPGLNFDEGNYFIRVRYSKNVYWNGDSLLLNIVSENKSSRLAKIPLKTNTYNWNVFTTIEEVPLARVAGFEPKEAKLNISVEEVDFNEVEISTSSEKKIPLKNTGTAILTGALSNSLNNVFQLSHSKFSILPNEEANITVSFLPDEEKVYSSIITIESNGGSLSIPVFGTGKKTCEIFLPAKKFSVDASMQDLDITGISASESLHAESVVDFIKVSSVDNDNGKISLLIDENLDTEIRTGKIRVFSGCTADTIIITQQGASCKLFSKTSELYIKNKGEQVKIELVSNAEVSVELPSWAEVESLSNEVLLIVFFENNSFDLRKGEIKIIAKCGAEVNIPVTQDARECSLNLLVDTLFVDSGENEVKLESIFTANDDYYLNINAEWVRQKNNNLIISSNSELNPRSLAISVVTSCGVEKIFYVYQAAQITPHLDPAFFEYSCELIAVLYNGNEIVNDGELLIFDSRNKTRSLVTTNEVDGKTLFKLMVYSNDVEEELKIGYSVNDEVVAVYPETFNFENDSKQGSYKYPVELNLQASHSREKETYTQTLTKGWNWLSIPYNSSEEYSIEDIIVGDIANNSYVKTREATSVYDQQTGGWFPDIKLSTLQGFKYYNPTSVEVIYQIEGQKPNVEKQIDAGYSFRGFLSEQVNDGLLCDYIKSQVASSEYYNNKWIGDLKELKQGKGYLVYKKNVLKSGSDKTFNSSDYKYSMSVFASIDEYQKGDSIVAFSTEQEELSALTGAIQRPNDGQPIFNLMIYSNEEQTNKEFRIKLIRGKKEFDMLPEEALIFLPDELFGTPISPVECSISSIVTSIANSHRYADIKVYPNPTKDLIHISSSEKLSGVKVYSLSGALLKTIDLNNSLSIDLSNFPVGIYMLNLNLENGERVVKRVSKIP